MGTKPYANVCDAKTMATDPQIDAEIRAEAEAELEQERRRILIEAEKDRLRAESPEGKKFWKQLKYTFIRLVK